MCIFAPSVGGASVAKYDISSVVKKVQKLYDKDDKSKAMITSGDTVKQTYAASDGVPVPTGNPLQELVGLPCVPYNKIIQISGPPDTNLPSIV